MPGALVDGVVDGDYGAHVWCGGIVGFAAHGVEEHLLRGVDPISSFLICACVTLVVCWAGVGCGWRSEVVGEGAWYCADFTVGAEAYLGENTCV